MCARTAQIIPLGKGPTYVVVGWHCSYRADGPDSWSGQSLRRKPTSGGRANWQAVTRVKCGQASEVKSWMPTRQGNGEGRAGNLS
jgi:hypothetical protein